ncbi:MAG: hypothetical protein JSW71_07040, partial [Gemmatimonadota bacterium]
GQIGLFAGGTRRRSIQSEDPVFGRVTHSECRDQGFWFASAVVRYELPQLGGFESYAVLGTGLYGFHERLLIAERTPEGVLVRAGRRSYQSHSHHPGASAGLGLGWELPPDGWLLLGEFRVHSIIGAYSGLYPVLVGSLGVAKKI